MLYGLYLSAAGLQAQERKQDVIANNLANANVNGFKRDLAMVQARANAVNEDPAMAAYRVSMLENQGGRRLSYERRDGFDPGRLAEIDQSDGPGA